VAEEYFVRDVMTAPVVSITPDLPLLDAALMLRGSAIRHLPVVRDGTLVGLLTDRDIQRCAPSRLVPITEEGYNSVFANTTVERVMTREPKIAASTTPLLGALALMQQGRYGCLPVVDEGVLVGILTRGDLLEALQQLLTMKRIAKGAVLEQ
jgi:acetoin utilization protein AcuB